MRCRQLQVESLETRIVLDANGFFALSGADAAAFDIPADVKLVSQSETHGLSVTRYQQKLGPADVLGGQLTVYHDDDGTAVNVIGAHYSQLTPTNRVGLGSQVAAAIADREVGAGRQRYVELQFDPDSQRFFYQVETRDSGSRWFHQIDAASGQVLGKFDGLARDHLQAGQGIGVLQDVKDLSPGPDWLGNRLAGGNPRDRLTDC